MQWTQLINPARTGEATASSTPWDEARSPFEQDFDRIVFSHPFRSLQDKTQVFPLPKTEFVHNRLTHSLEVASVGRSLGKQAGKAILQRHADLRNTGITISDFGAITAAAALMHDIGNPPFGHAGESAISQFFVEQAADIKPLVSEKEWHDLVNFEGNAQGFRLVNKNRYQGLQLTMATQGAFTKYPREAHITSRDEARKSQKKYGFLQAHKSAFTDVAGQLGLRFLGNTHSAVWCRHPLAFLVEAADDICYSIIDLEDGTNLGLLPYTHTEELLAGILGDSFQKKKIDVVSGIKEKLGLLRALAINELVRQCVEVFTAQEEAIRSGDFDKALTDKVPAWQALKEIQKVSVEKIYRSELVLRKEVAGFEVISGLLGAFCMPVLQMSNQQEGTWKAKSLYRLLPIDIRAEIESAGSTYLCLLSLLDYISGLTDSAALNLYRNIKGISLPDG
jgi:dGTPase